MFEIKVTNETYKRLQEAAETFVDTPETVIIKALDALAESGGTDSSGKSKQEIEIDVHNLPKLTHTKVLNATISDEIVPKPNWHKILKNLVELSISRVDSVEELNQLCDVNIIEGKKEDEGYSFLSGSNISLQGVDANGAVRTIVTLAKIFEFKVKVQFLWRNKPGAEYPGKRGILRCDFA